MEPIAPGISNLNLLSTEEVLPEENSRLMSTLDQFKVISDEIMKISYNDIVDQAVTSKKVITKDDIEAMYSASIFSYIKTNVDQALHIRPFEVSIYQNLSTSLFWQARLSVRPSTFVTIFFRPINKCY